LRELDELETGQDFTPYLIISWGIWMI